MGEKLQLPDSSKYCTGVISPYRLAINVYDILTTTKEQLNMSPEERGRALYESLKKKYEEGS